jgi:arsenite methyltransferase
MVAWAGGFGATNELLALCHIKNAQEVLDVGCAIGVGPAYMAKTYGCRVVGVDISERMIEWSRQRAKQEGVEDRVELRIADVLDLPFEADRFDVVICESVLAFIEDEPRAIRQCVRVAKPSGYVGLNEAVWIEEPPPEKAAQALEWGTNILTAEAWQALWEGSGLQDRVVRTYQIDARSEIKSRMRWVGWSWVLKAWYRVLSLYLKDPAARQFIKEQLDTPCEMFGYLGYGLFVGRK